MHYLKRVAAAVAALLLILCLSPAALAAADSDSFLESHAAECCSDGRSYYLNGRSGYVSVYRSPLSPKAEDYLLNERCVRVLRTWQDEQGRPWGQLRYETSDRGVGHSVDEGGRFGWVLMREMQLRYDKTQFVLERLDDFVMESVTLDMRDYDSVILWPYPGSGGQGSDASWYLRREEDNVLEFPAYWVDSLGRRWGGYTFFDADGFICIDEPGLTENTLPEVPAVSRITPAADAATLPRTATAAVLRTGALWGGAAIGGAVLVLLVFFLLRRKRRRNS
ncbi:MAG: hypothetical protein IJE26_07185 [Oscillospiraceae bacterium]|nr:hypothetical protein [Oscillospiraceae bacterium]